MRKLKITLYSVNSTLRSTIRTAFKGAQYDVLEVTDATKAPQANVNEEQQAGTIGRLNLPHRADYVVTTTALNSKVEGLAATLALRQSRNDVYAVVLPEGMDYLRAQLDKRGELVLVGSDQAK